MAEKSFGYPHYWLIDRANGPFSHGKCAWCGEERDFSNSTFISKRFENVISREIARRTVSHIINKR